jgi:hypothetical protein
VVAQRVADAQGYCVSLTAVGRPFVRASSDIVSNTLFATADRRATTTVTTVDSAGNECVLPIGSASTTRRS